MMNVPLFLVADVGGTNTRVALAQGRLVQKDSIRRYPNDAHPNLESVLASYAAETGHPQPQPQGVGIDVAGPVLGETARLTNRDWSFSCAALRAATQAPLAVILNDMQAQGHALGSLDPQDVQTILPGETAPPQATCVVVNVGTGFNIAPVFSEQNGTLVPPAEAGHASLLTPRPEDLRLAAYVAKSHGFAAVEDVLSGRGLERVYAWCAEEAGAPERKTAAQIMAAASDPLAQKTIAIFARHLGQICGDYALQYLAYGGIYLVGGVACAMAPHLGQEFTQAFENKGRFSEFVGKIGVRIVTDDYAGLKGCAAHLAAQHSA